MQKAKQLYYIDYNGTKTKISLTKDNAIQDYFTENSTKNLTYNQVKNDLKPNTQGPLPTEEQLAALKEGLLGNIMENCEEQSILAGTKLPKDQPHNISLECK